VASASLIEKGDVMADDASGDRRRDQNCEVVHEYLRAEFPDSVPVETPTKS
jgi:hypothetical protein